MSQNKPWVLRRHFGCAVLIAIGAAAAAPAAWAQTATPAASVGQPPAAYAFPPAGLPADQDTQGACMPGRPAFLGSAVSTAARAGPPPRAVPPAPSASGGPSLLSLPTGN